MSWTDLESIEHIKKLRDKFKIKAFIETGTHMGINALLHRKNFDIVFTVENNLESYERMSPILSRHKNIYTYLDESKYFLANIVPQKKETVFFYLDAHFYDPKLKQKFVVLDELDALKGFKNCVIAIHDFDNGLGHITYDGQPLNLDLMRKKLLKVNPKFKFYTNELSSCRIKKLEEAESWDEFDNLKYVWSKPEKTYRGILYAVPKEVKIDGLKLIR